MVSLFVLVFLVTLIWFFIARRKDKKVIGKITRQTWYLLFVSIASFLIVGALSPKPDKSNSENSNTQSSSSINKEKASSSSSKYSKSMSSSSASSSSGSVSSSSSKINDFSFSKVEPGMNMDQVISAIGKQPTERDDMTLYYGKDDIDFSNGVLIGSSVKSIQDKVDAKFKQDASQASSKKKDANNLKSYAQYFGNLPVENIQSKPYAYKSSKIDNGMRYLYMVKNNSFLVRIDTDDSYTNVYSYDGNPDGALGSNLFTGRTIFNNPEKKNYYYLGGK
ncbi:hypothetical protein [Leuconostoc citreum]|uniref:hypothetical protein n=1 Tax=Leuconostoc citreum TaxID=33964 RepID=UPI00186B8D92|nr:hypothetical protein [Leuconostoc citreum]MBE4725814.1 hypothetical protein [Leuconostoc citreum]